MDHFLRVKIMSVTRNSFSIFFAVLFAFVFAAASQAGLIGYWAFDDGTGSSTAADSAGSHTGTLTNFTPATDWVTGHTGGAGDYALDFGTTANQRYVNMTTFKGITGRGARTMSAWIKTSNNTNHDIMSWGANNNGEKWVFRVQDQNGAVNGNLRVEVNGGFRTGSTVLGDNTWRHVVATWENDGTANINDLKLYEGGSLETNDATTGNNVNTANSQTFRVGGESFGTRFFDGLIDDVAIFNRVLTAAEIAQLAGGTAPNAITTVAPDAALHYDAAQDASPTNGTWEDIKGLSTTHNWAINNNGGGARYITVNDSAVPGITNAYTFAGAADTATTASFDSFSGNPTTHSASFEMWFKPSDVIGQEILLETGGNGTGSSLAIDGNQVLFTSSSGSAATTEQLTYGGLTADYIQVVAVIEQTAAGADLSLFINGNPTPVATVSNTAGMTDWAGTDGSGLGDTSGTIGGDNTGLLTGYANFSGEIAIVRFYDVPLTGADVQTLYDAIVPEPSTLLLAVIGLLGLTAWGRRKSTKD